MSDVESSSIRLEDGEIDEGSEPCVSSSSLTTGDPKESAGLSPQFVEEVMNSSEECDGKASQKRPNLEECPQEKNQPEVTSSSSRSAFEMKEAFDRFEEDEMLCVRGASPLPFVCAFVDQTPEASRSCFSRNTPPRDSDCINNDVSLPKRSSKSSHRRQRRKRSLPKKVVREKYVSSDDGQSDEPKSKKSQNGRSTAQETSQQICKFYYLDSCAKGSNCMYMHSQFPCKYFYLGLKCPDEEATGKCKLSHGKELSAYMKNALCRHINTAPTSILGEEFVALRRSFASAEKMIEHHEQKLQAAARPEGSCSSDKIHSPTLSLKATANSQEGTACEASIPAASTFSQAELDFFEQLKEMLFFLDQSQLDMLKEFRMTKVEDLSNLTLAQLNAVGILAVQIDAIQRGFETSKGQDTDMRNLYQCAPLNLPFENFANNVDLTVEVVELEENITNSCANWEEEEETSLVIDESAQEDEDRIEDNIEIDVVGDESPIYVEPVKEGETDPLLENKDETQCSIDSPKAITTEVSQEELQDKPLFPAKIIKPKNLGQEEIWDEESQQDSVTLTKQNDESTPTTEASLKNPQDETPPPLDDQSKNKKGPKLRRRTRFRSISPPNTNQDSVQMVDSTQEPLSPNRSTIRKDRTSESEEMWDEDTSDIPLKASDEAPKTVISGEKSLDVTPAPLEEPTKIEKAFIKDASDKELRLLKRTKDSNPFRTEKAPLKHHLENETNDFWEKDSRHVTPPNVTGQTKGFPITPRKLDSAEAFFIDTTPTKYTGEYTRRNIDPQSNDLRHLLTQRTLQKEMGIEMQGDNSSEDWDADEPKSAKTPIHQNDNICFPDNSDMDSAVFVPDGICPHLPLRTPNLDNYKPAIEIDAHLTYPAMDYKLYEIYLPPYDVNKPRLMEKLLKSNSSDPRLKKLLEREKNGGIFPQSEYSFFPPGMPQVDPRLRLGSSTASTDPNYNASPILYGYLQRSLWYQELKSNLKIQINHSVSDLVRALNAFHKDPSPKKIFDLFQIECAGVLLEVMRNVGIFIDANGNIIEEPNYKQLCAPQFLAQPVKPGLLGYAPPGATYSRPQMPLALPPNENSFARQAFGNDFGYSNNEFQPPPTGFYVGERNFQNNRGGPPTNFEPPAFQRPGGNRNPQRRL